MKYILTFLVFISLCFVQCTDLELAPEDAFTETEIFKDPAAYTSYLAKIYASYSLTGQDGPSGDSDISIVNDEGFTSYIRAYWKAQELTTDEAVIAWTDAGIRDMHVHTWSSENQFVRVLYYRIALIVSFANDFLKQSTDEKLAENGISDADQDIIRAYRDEVRFLRALAYWHALDLFGNVVISQEIKVGFPTQSSPQELFAFIESELADIEGRLPDARQNQYGRIDKAGLWMLQAKLYQNAEAMIGESKYEESQTALLKVLDAGYTLDPNYQAMFMKDNHESPEIIFALNADGKNTQSWGSTTFLVHAAIGGSMLDTDYGVLSGWAGLRTTSALLDKFPDLTGDIDGRAIFYTDGQSVEIDDIGVFEQGIAVPKWTNTNLEGVAGSDNTHADTDYGMFRLGDAYLMYAENVLRGAVGSNAQAVTYINALRERAYGNSDGNITEGELNLDFILDERARELYWEGTRRVDLIRFGKFSGSSYLWPWKGNVKEGAAIEDFRKIFPIPASDLLANPNLEQNDGY